MYNLYRIPFSARLEGAWTLAVTSSKSQALRSHQNKRERLGVYVLAQFNPWFKFYFPLFLVIVMYDNELKQRKINFEPRIKLDHSIYACNNFLRDTSPSSNVVHKQIALFEDFFPMANIYS